MLSAPKQDLDALVQPHRPGQLLTTSAQLDLAALRLARHRAQDSHHHRTVASCEGQLRLDRGIQVLLWRTEHMPLLGLGPWSQLVVQAQATAWLAHGYATPILGGGAPGASC